MPSYMPQPYILLNFHLIGMKIRDVNLNVNI